MKNPFALAPAPFRLRRAGRSVLLAALVSLAGVASSPGALIGYWKFDENTGTTAADSSGVGTPHTGTLGVTATGAAVPAWIPGRFGSALDFNRLNDGNGGRVTVPFQADLQLNNAFTISFWYRPGPNIGTFPGPMRIGVQSATTGTTIGWGFYRAQSSATIVFKRGNIQPNYWPTAMVNGTWYHIVIRHDGGTANTGLSFNVSTNTIAQSWLDATATSIFEFGRMDQHDDCDLDDVAFFDEALPIERIYTINSVPTKLGVDYNLGDVRALWTIFDGGVGSSGTVKGSTWTYTSTLPGSTTLGDAYVSGSKWYVVLGAGVGLTANALLLGDQSPAGVGVVGTQNLTETPTYGASTRFVFDLGAATTEGGGVNDLFNITGDFNVLGNSVVINPMAPLAAGTYRLINYTGAKTGTLNATVVHNSRYTITLSEAPGQVNVVVSGTPGDVDWFSASSGAWDFTTLNWSNTVALTTDRFRQADTISFDEASTFATNITLSLDVFPHSMAVNSATRHYAISGAGRIGGLTGGLTKDGASLLALNTANLFVGPVSLNAGWLRMGNASALGTTNSGTTIASGATLDMVGNSPGLEPVTVGGPGVNSTGAVINTGASLVNNGLRGPVTLTGNTTFGGINRWDVFGGVFAGNDFKLTKTGPPEIALSNLGNSGLGDIDVLQGQLTILGSTLMGNPAKPVIVSPGATLAHWASAPQIHNKRITLNNARLLNGTSPVTDVATNVATITLIGTNTVDGAANVALLGEVTGNALTKVGTGTLHLGGTNTYTGPTAINAGTVALVANGSIATSPTITIASGAALETTARTDGTITLASGQTLSGNGTVRGSVTAGTGVNVGPGASAGTLTFTNALNLTGGAILTYELAGPTTPGGGTNDLINVGGALNLSSSTTLRLVPIGNLTLGSPYTLMSYSGPLTGGAANFTTLSDSRVAWAIDTTTTPGKVLATASGAPLLIEWVGGTAPLPTTWDTKTTGNWLGNDFGEKFFAGDSVVFSDFADQFTVTLAGDLYPAAVSVESDLNDYTFTGSGRIRGGALTKSFNAKLTLANTGVNDYPGPTTVTAGGGTLQVGNGGTSGNLGPGPVIVDGILAFNRSDDLTLVNSVTGAGTVRKDGPNQLFLGASMVNFNGTVAATAGTLRPTVATGLGTVTGGTAISGTGIFEINSINYGAEPITISGAGSGAGAIVNTLGAGQNNAFQFLTLSGNATVGGSQRWDVRANPGGSVTGNGFNLTKTGANQVSLVSVGDTGLGDINVQQGLLSIEGTTGLGLPGGTVSVQSGATLMLWGNTIVQAKNFALNNGARLFKDNGAATISGTGTLTGSNGVDTANNAGTDLTLSGVISGTGSLNKLGAGNLFLTAANDYSGGTRVSAANLFLGNGGTSGSVAGNIQVDTSLYFYRSDTFTLANNITGVGSLFLRTAGGMILDGSSQINMPAGAIEVGRDLYGKLIIRSGANPIMGRMLLGNIANTPGDVVQEGGNVWVTLEARVGHWPTETSLYLLGGGTFNVTNIPTGTVNPAGTPEQNGCLYLGIDGVGIFTQTGGVATVHGIVLDGRGATAGDDTFNLEGGTININTSGIKSGNLDATTTYKVNLGGGTINASGSWASSRLMTLTGTNGDVTFNTAGNTITLSGVLSGVGGLKKTGAGTLRLSATNTYTGTTLVNGGTLDGNGILVGPLVVAAGGTVGPGTSVGVLTVSNTVSLGGIAAMEISKTGATRTNDAIAGATRITYGGTLTVTATGDTLADGDTFKLFSAATYAGSFANTNLPTLGPGLLWDLNQLLISGTIRVTDNRPPVPGLPSLSTVRNRAVTYATAKVLDAATDPENDPMAFTALMPLSTNGAAVVLNADRITYTPLTDFIGVDRFSYVINDNQGGQSLGQAEVLVYPGNVPGLNILSVVMIGSDFQFTFAGIPGRTYAIERAAAVSGPWTQVATAVCDPHGVTSFLDTAPPPGTAFYRTRDLTP